MRVRYQSRMKRKVIRKSGNSRASWESITKLVSFSVFSCRTIINSLRREGRERTARYSRGGSCSPASNPGSRPKGRSSRPDHGHLVFSGAATMEAAAGWQHWGRACHSQTETGLRRVVGRRRAGSLSAAAASPPHLGNHLHWKWKLPSRELRRELPPPAAARPVVDQ